MDRLIKDKQFYKTLFVIALPIALQNLITYGVSLMDNIMVGALSQEQLSAVTLANQPFFIFTLLTLGLAGGCTVLVSQYWGKKDIASIQRVFSIAIKIALLFSVICASVVLLFPRQIMSIFTDKPVLIDYGVSYLNIVGYSYLLYGISNTFVIAMRSVENVKIALIVYGSSFLVNVFFNWVFIFGKLGAPAMGAAGAAVGTLIARSCEFIMVMVYIFRIEKRVQFRWKHLISHDKILFQDFIKYSIPVVLNELIWSLAISTQLIILEKLGADVVAASSIASTMQQVSNVLLMGVANAAGVVIGKLIGSGQEQMARKAAFSINLCSVVIGFVCGLLLILLKDAIISIYNIPEHTKWLASSFMLWCGLMTFFMSISLTNVIGIFRGGGDTKYALYVDLLTLWFFSLPLGFVARLIPGISPLVVYMALRSDEILKLVLCLFRLKSGKWLSNVTREETAVSTE